MPQHYDTERSTEQTRRIQDKTDSRARVEEMFNRAMGLVNEGTSIDQAVDQVSRSLSSDERNSLMSMMKEGVEGRGTGLMPMTTPTTPTTAMRAAPSGLLRAGSKSRRDVAKGSTPSQPAPPPDGYIGPASERIRDLMLSLHNPGRGLLR